MKKDMMKPENKTYDSVHEMFKDMKKDFKDNHPIRYWIDHSLFPNNGFFGYAPHVFFIRPWIATEYIWGHTVWAWQRVFRGWDDRVVWSIDSYIAKMLPQWIDSLKERKHGIPFDMFPEGYLMHNNTDEKIEKKASEKYDAILDKIILGFKSYVELDARYDLESKEYKKLQKNFDTGFDLFKKHFGSLWD